MKILLVEDNPGDARLLLEMFDEQGSESTEVAHVACMSEAEKHLATHAVDIVVLDLGLPDAQGLETERRARAAAPHVPLVVLTGLDDESLAVQSLQEGAQDYFIKGKIETRGFRRALRYAIERKILEEALMAEAEQLRMSAARLHDSGRHLARAQEFAESGSFEHDFRTGQVIWSDNLCRILGVDKKSLTGNGVSELIHPADRERFDNSWRANAMGIATPATEFRIVHPDGSCRTISVECASSSSEDGTARSLFGTVHDVTSAKAAADGRLRALEPQLRHSQKIEALGMLAGGIAHDLNNALMPVIMMTDIVMETQAEDSPERAHLGLALAGARRAKELVRRILTFARKETTEKRKLDLAALVTEALAMLGASLPATIELISLVDPIPAVFGDLGELYQVIVNLVTNAAQAIGDEPGKVIVTLRSVPGEAQIELAVADTGSGMDEQTRQRIFDPFFTTKAVNAGTGLGLSIVHGIVAAHAGTIAVTSQLGRGSTFTITLPLAGQRPEDDAETIPAAA